MSTTQWGERHAQIIAHAEAYVALGWRVFVLSADGARKIPPADCDRCRRQPKSVHDPEACACLTCHGFYAATSDVNRLREALARVPHGHLAIRTGAVSQLLVVDAEAHGRVRPDGVEEPSGLETLERWSEATGEEWELPHTAMARSVSGGVHLFYRLPAEIGYVKSGRILPGVDVKADGGYVGAVAGVSSRHWVVAGDGVMRRVVDAPEELLTWLQRGRRKRLGGRDAGGWSDVTSGAGGGTGGGLPPGYDFVRFSRDGAPDGFRNHFINDLLFRTRKAGQDVGEVLEVAKQHWLRLAQPGRVGGAGSARWEMPWYEVEDMARRVCDEVVPDVPPGARREWARRAARATRTASERGVSQVGKVTITGVSLGKNRKK